MKPRFSQRCKLEYSARQQMWLPETSIIFCPSMTTERHLTTVQFEAGSRRRFESKPQSLIDRGHLELRQVFHGMKGPEVIIVTTIESGIFKDMHKSSSGRLTILD